MRPGERAILDELRVINETTTADIDSFAPTVRDVLKPRPKAKPYTIRQSVLLTAITGSTTVEVDQEYSFSLQSISNATAFEQIFDQWRIRHVTIKFIPVDTKISSGTNAPAYVVIDYDDTNATTVATLQQYDTLSVVPCGIAHERNLRPRCAPALYSGAFTSFGSTSEQWVDTNSPGVAWYGVKVGVPLSPNPPQWQVLAEITFQFRNPH